LKKTLLALAISIGATSATHAGALAWTSHSRANCAGVNESITWYALGADYWRVFSVHNYKNPTYTHTQNTFLQYSWRIAVVHFNEAIGTMSDGWFVQGYHFVWRNGKEQYEWYTEGTDCSGWDGWVY
jgi:hypothetical protein